ncbi:hypothetical protein LEMLEM_LOCUS17726 [Lemmus lemmus]
MGSRRVWVIDSAHITTDSTTAASSPLLMTFEEAGDLRKESTLKCTPRKCLCSGWKRQGCRDCKISKVLALWA